MPAAGIDLETGAENPAQVIELSRSQDEIIFVGDHAYLCRGGEVTFDAFNAQRFNKFFPGKLRLPAFEIGNEILIEVVQERAKREPYPMAGVGRQRDAVAVRRGISHQGDVGYQALLARRNCLKTVRILGQPPETIPGKGRNSAEALRLRHAGKAFQG